MAHSSSEAACAAGPPCVLGQRATALGQGAWEQSCPCSAEPWQAGGGSAVPGLRVAALEHSAVFL